MLVFFAAQAERFLSGTHIIFSSGRELTTSIRFADVQQMSTAAFTSAVVFTYATTGAPGWSRFMSFIEYSLGYTSEGLSS